MLEPINSNKRAISSLTLIDNDMFMFYAVVFRCVPLNSKKLITSMGKSRASRSNGKHVKPTVTVITYELRIKRKNILLPEHNDRLAVDDDSLSKIFSNRFRFGGLNRRRR